MLICIAFLVNKVLKQPLTFEISQKFGSASLIVWSLLTVCTILTLNIVLYFNKSSDSHLEHVINFIIPPLYYIRLLDINGKGGCLQYVKVLFIVLF